MAGAKLPDDVVKYSLFLPSNDSISDKDNKEWIEERLVTYLAFLGEFFLDHIWQEEPFKLRLVSENPTGISFVTRPIIPVVWVDNETSY